MQHSVRCYNIFKVYFYSYGFKRHALNIICTDNMKSCDMRGHSDWLRVILGYKSVQIFHSAIILKLKVRTQVQRYRKIDLKDVDIAKNFQIVGLNDQNIKQWIYSFGTDKCQNRPTKTLNFVNSL